MTIILRSTLCSCEKQFSWFWVCERPLYWFSKTSQAGARTASERVQGLRAGLKALRLLKAQTLLWIASASCCCESEGGGRLSLGIHVGWTRHFTKLCWSLLLYPSCALVFSPQYTRAVLPSQVLPLPDEHRPWAVRVCFWPASAQELAGQENTTAELTALPFLHRKHWLGH